MRRSKRNIEQSNIASTSSIETTKVDSQTLGGGVDHDDVIKSKYFKKSEDVDKEEEEKPRCSSERVSETQESNVSHVSTSEI